MGALTSFFSSASSTVIAAIVALSILVSGGLYIDLLRTELKTTKADRASIEAQLNESQLSVKQLQLELSNQNDAITKMQNDADKRVASHQEEINTAVQYSNSLKTRANSLIVNSKIEDKMAGKNECNNLNDLLNNELTEGK